MTKQTARPAKEERYANLIPMKELQFEKDRLFPFPIYEKLRECLLFAMTNSVIAGMFLSMMTFNSS